MAQATAEVGFDPSSLGYEEVKTGFDPKYLGYEEVSKSSEFDPASMGYEEVTVEQPRDLTGGVSLSYPETVQPTIPEEFKTDRPGIIEQILQLPKVFRATGAQTGLTTAGGFEAFRAKALRKGAASPEALAGRLVGMKQMSPEERVTTAIDRANTLSIQRATESSQEFLQAASTAPEDYGLDPRLETGLITQAGRGLAKGAGMFAIASAGGIPALALQGSTEAFGAAKQHGKSDDEADKEATRALIALAIFGGANRAVSSGISRYLGNASKLKTFLVQMLGQTVGNEVTSRSISAYEAALDSEPGKRMDAAVTALTKNDPASIAQNFGFAAMGGMESARARAVAERNELQLPEAAAENARRAQAELARTEKVIAEQNLTASRLGEQRVAAGHVAGPEISHEAVTPEIRTRAETPESPIIKGAPAPSQLQQGEKKEISAEDIDASLEKLATAEPPSTEGTSVAGPALLVNGEVAKQGTIGQSHGDLKIEAAKQGEDLTGSNVEHGFVDDKGNPLTREQGFALAQKAGQLNKESLAAIGKTQLESQDLKPIEPNAIQIRPAEEVLRNVPEQPEGLTQQVPPEEGAQRVPPGGVREAQPEIPAEEKVNPFSAASFAPIQTTGLLHGTNLEASNPLGLVVSLKTQEGEIVSGKPGQLHMNMNIPPGSELGFTDKNGNFLTRKEASNATLKALNKGVLAEEKVNQSANELQKFKKEAMSVAEQAGATDADVAVSEAQLQISKQGSSDKALFLDAVRKQALNQAQAAGAEKRGGGKLEEIPEEPSLASGGPTPAQEVIRSETIDIVSRAVQSLPENQRKVMQMTMEERSDKEIASELGMTEGAVRQARSNARNSLKEQLSSKVDWTGATDDSSLIDDIRSDISAIKTPQKLGVVPQGSTSIMEAFDKLKAIGKEALSVGKVNDLRRGILHWVAKVQKSFGEVSEAQKVITKTVKDPIRRDGITNWIEANGDRTLLEDRASKSKDPPLKKGYEAAQTLSPSELNLANKIRDAFNTMHQRGVDNEVLNSFVDNYVNHIWEKKPQRLTYSSKSLRDSFRFSRARVFKTFFEGEQAGFMPKTKDIAKLLPVYIHEMNSVIAARQLVRDLSSGTASDGRPLVSPRGVVKTIEEGDKKSYLVIPKIPKDADTSDYKVLDQPALTTWNWKGKDVEGNPIFVKSDLALHPEAHERLKRALGISEIKKWYSSEGSQLASIPKSIVRALDTTQNTVKQTMLGFLSTFHVAQEAYHGLAHRVMAFRIPKIDLAKNPDQYRAAQLGLMLNPDRISERVFMEGLGQSGIISKIPGIGKVADAFSSWMFHEFIPGLKYKTYTRILERNLKLFKPELSSGKVTEEEIGVLSAEQANASYGHLNYADLGRDPTIQHLLQLGLLAPDFLEARGRFAGQALKGALGAKSGREQLAALAFIAAFQVVSSQIINQLADGKMHLDHPFEIRVKNRRYVLRSVPEDIFNMIRDTRRFAYGRINPIMGKGAVQLMTGQNYRGEKVDARETMAELVAQAIPLTIQPLPGVRNLTETGRNQPVSPLEQFAGSMGLRISRYSPISDVYQLASKWEDEKGVPRDKGSYPISKYQQLRYALEDIDEEKALNEYKKLRETMSAYKIDQGFRESMNHPFTQSQKMDVEFFKSLKPEDQERFKLAQQKRKDIIQRFHRMKK